MLLPLVLLAAIAAPGDAAPPDASVQAPPPATRIAVLPPENLSGGVVPIREFRSAVELSIARAGFEVIGGSRIDDFMARHRIRYTGGVDRAAAAAARAELGASAILVTSVELLREGPPPRLAIAMRLVEASDAPAILWIDSVGRAGDDSPGFLSLRIVPTVSKLQQKLLATLGESLRRATERRGPAAPACPSEGRFAPTIAYAAPPAPADGKPLTVAVIPFLTDARRRGPGDVLATQFVRQLLASGAFRVLEPGVVRDEVLRKRVIMQGGISFDTARMLLGVLDVDVVLAGHVLDFVDAGAGGVPRVAFSSIALSTRTGEVAWQFSSHARGDDGVLLYGKGTISTASELSCRLVRKVVDRMVESAADAGRARAPPARARR